MEDGPPDDLLDDEAWDEAERFWQEEVNRIAVEVGQGGEWPSWEAKYQGDTDTPIPHEFRSSICDGRSWTLDRAFSINQSRLVEGTAEIWAWVQDWVKGIEAFPDIEEGRGDEWFDEMPARERVPRSTLNIYLQYSDDTVAVARSLLAVWLRPETTVAEMSAFIDTTPAGSTLAKEVEAVLDSVDLRGTASGSTGEYANEVQPILVELLGVHTLEELEAVVRDAFDNSDGGARVLDERRYEIAAQRLWDVRIAHGG